jgi:hypothetical protein
MPGGTILPVLGGLGCSSQTPCPYDAYSLRARAGKKRSRASALSIPERFIFLLRQQPIRLT